MVGNVETISEPSDEAARSLPRLEIFPLRPDGIGSKTSWSRIADLFRRPLSCNVPTAESNISYSRKNIPVNPQYCRST